MTPEQRHLHWKSIDWQNFQKQIKLWRHNHDGGNPSLQGDAARLAADMCRARARLHVQNYPDFPAMLEQAEFADLNKTYLRMMKVPK